MRLAGAARRLPVPECAGNLASAPRAAKGPFAVQKIFPEETLMRPRCGVASQPFNCE